MPFIHSGSRPAGSSRSRRSAPIAIAIGVVLSALAPAAPAATYPAGGGAFAVDAEGWQATEESCNVTLLSSCEASGEHDATGGNPPGTLTARTSVTLNLAAVFDSTVVFESPDFTIAAAGPATLHAERQFIPGGLLTLAPEATLSVSLIDRSTETPTEVIGETLGDDDVAFAGKDGAASIVAGRTYAIAVEVVTTAAAALGLTETDSHVRFDNVVMTVQDAGEGGPGGPGGKSGAPGVAGLTSTDLLTSVRRGDAASAGLRGKHVFVRLRCPMRAGGACRITAQGRIRKRVRVTHRRTVRIAKGRSRVVALRVRPRFLRKLAKRKRLLVVQKVRVGEVTATYARSRALIRR
jgi:hypothetical protein